MRNEKKLELFYQIHIFICQNQKELPKKSCGLNGDELFLYMKKKCADLQIKDIRVNKAGCLGVCSKGPAMVIYPEGIWYHYTNILDIDEIVEQHILKNNIVERLKIDKG